jgi:hypothetical protein
VTQVTEGYVSQALAYEQLFDSTESLPTDGGERGTQRRAAIAGPGWGESLTDVSVTPG